MHTATYMLVLSCVGSASRPARVQHASCIRKDTVLPASVHIASFCISLFSDCYSQLALCMCDRVYKQSLLVSSSKSCLPESHFEVCATGGDHILMLS